jgi:hypothetical protein
MENTGEYIGNKNFIAGNSHLTSDVPIQYFSWAEYDFMRPPIKKVNESSIYLNILTIIGCRSDDGGYDQQLWATI